MWIGGAISRAADTGLVIRVFIVTYGATPGQAMADLLSNLPPWITNPWFKLALVVIGLSIIGGSLHFNVWSLRQRAIDDLAEDLSWAIHHLLNKTVSDQPQGKRKGVGSLFSLRNGVRPYFAARGGPI